MMLTRLFATLIFTALSLSSLLSMPQKEVSVHEIIEKAEPAEPVVASISEYDDVMRDVEAVSGVDWRLLSAIACTESQFRSGAVSEMGAVGLMQIMPSIGSHFGFSPEELSDPFNNVYAAAALLREIDTLVRLPESLPARDRWGIILACYNCGYGHVNDARRLARAFDENGNSWNAVSHYLCLKNDREYYEHEVVANGQFKSGRITTAYVRRVLDKYEHYCRITSPSEK